VGLVFHVANPFGGNGIGHLDDLLRAAEVLESHRGLDARDLLYLPIRRLKTKRDGLALLRGLSFRFVAIFFAELLDLTRVPRAIEGPIAAALRLEAVALRVHDLLDPDLPPLLRCKVARQHH